MIPAGRRVIQHFAGGVEPASTVDDRVARAVAYLKQSLGRSISLDEVAEVVNLSLGDVRRSGSPRTSMARHAASTTPPPRPPPKTRRRPPLSPTRPRRPRRS